MNIHATSARYMRLATLAIFLFSCGQTKCADARIDLKAVVGAAFAGVSAIARLANDPWSKLGLVLDATCFATNTHAVCGGTPYKPLAIVEAGCILGLGLQYTRYIPALTLGANDPLGPLRALLSLTNGFIIGSRFWNNYINPI